MPAMATISPIRAAREAANLTQIDLAKKLGVNQGCISRYETGTGRPHVDVAFKLAKLLKIDLDIILARPQPKRRRRSQKAAAA
jgi:transcriptional regulator with XRE-family HTH domain